jgi:hypothetical protein
MWHQESKVRRAWGLHSTVRRLGSARIVFEIDTVKLLLVFGHIADDVHAALVRTATA